MLFVFSNLSYPLNNYTMFFSLYLVFPLIYYCSPVFVSLNSKNRTALDRVINRYKLLLPLHTSTGTGISTLDIHYSILQISLSFFNSCLHPDHILHSYVPPVYHKKYHTPYSKTLRRKSSFFPYIVNFFNNS